MPGGGPGSRAVIDERQSSEREHRLERLMPTLKEELLYLREWASVLHLERALAAWVDLYNTRYLHSTLRYRRPCHFEQGHRATVKITDSLSIVRTADQSRTDAPWLVPVWVGPDQTRILACGIKMKPGSSAAKHFLTTMQGTRISSNSLNGCV
ncbi:MAG: hypothetical protein CV088_10735 [Nitrospira sp. LK70]|nr:hypothetical protein [Nitrospira sp. LK70]